MGNKIGRRRQAVDDKHTRPQGLYQHQCMDRKKLRKLILDSKLAPCFLGEEDCALDLEECPICFLYYPSLNRSRCCTKGICTECFLQMKPPNSTRSTQCPFCKTSNYSVEYRGVRTKEEKGLEQLEEQKVIEAQIRIRQKEQRDDEERTQSRYEMAGSSTTVTPLEAENQEISMPSCGKSKQGNELGPSQGSCGVLESKRPSHSGQNREDNFDLDLEEIMVMEAIWLSIQDQGGPSGGLGGAWSSEDGNAVDATESSSSGGFAQAIAALAEHQQMNTESPPAVGVGEETGRWSEVAEAGTSYASSEANMASRHILPDSFEEQTMLAMAVSLAEARARTVSQELTWPLHM